MLPLFASVALCGCRSQRVDRVESASGAVVLDSAAVSVGVASVERRVDRDVCVRSIREIRSAGGDTVVTLTVITDRSRVDEGRCDSVASAVGRKVEAEVRASADESAVPVRNLPPWWVWAICAAAVIAMLRRHN